jgi:hypothetical protein
LRGCCQCSGHDKSCERTTHTILPDAARCPMMLPSDHERNVVTSPRLQPRAAIPAPAGSRAKIVLRPLAACRGYATRPSAGRSSPRRRSAPRHRARAAQ